MTGPISCPEIVTVTLNPVLDRTLRVQVIEFDEMIRAVESRSDLGGKGFNVSRALKGLGRESLALGLVGGATGEKLAQGLQALGIATDFVPIAGETRSNIVISEAASERYIKVNEAGPTVHAAEADAFLDLVQRRVRPGQLWVLAGSLPPGLPRDFYATLIKRIHSAGARAALDSSGEPLRLGLAARPFLAKPNALEAAEISGRPVDSPAAALAAAQLFLSQGIEWVALSMGVNGLLLATRSEAIWARPPGVAARHPTGAGDALLAGVAAAIMDGLPLAEVARWGVAAGTAAAMQDGVAVGSAADVRALLPQITVTRG